MISTLRLAILLVILGIRLNGYAQVDFTHSNLPIILINTNGQEIQDEPKITADMKVIYNGVGQENYLTDTVFHYNGKIGIELRGSSSQMFPKKPYGFETRKEDGDELDVKLLDMPKESDWTLNATYNDKTLMRDGLTYILAGSFMDYAPRVRYAELMVNGEYQGIYLVVEKIKRDKNRVNIPKISPADSTGDAITGGYILKIDKFTGSNSGEGWNSPYPPYPGAWQSTFFQYEYPKAEDITTAQKNYIKGHITQIEDILNSDTYQDTATGYRKYIDTKSLIDFIIVNELSKNPDAYRLSTFFYKERDSDGGKIKFGPVWDFNLGLGNVDYCTNGDPNGLVIDEFNKVCPDDGWVIHFWWQRFLQDSSFYHDLKLRWHDLRQAQLSDSKIFGLVDSLATLVDQAKDRNFEQWPVLGQYVWPNYYVGNTYGEEINFLQGWLTQRLAYLDSVWRIETTSKFNQPFVRDNDLLIFPNPVKDWATIDLRGLIPAATLQVSDLKGNLLQIPVINAGEGKFDLDFSGYPTGVYFIRAIVQDKVKICRVVKL